MIQGTAGRRLPGVSLLLTLPALVIHSVPGLAAACELREAGGRRRMLAAVGLATLAIPASLWMALPGMTRYRGLSGIDSALFVLLAVTLLREEMVAGRRGWAWAGGLALAAFGAKLGYEVITGAALFLKASGGAVPVPLAHLVGGLCGLAAALPATHRNAPWRGAPFQTSTSSRSSSTAGAEAGARLSSGA